MNVCVVGDPAGYYCQQLVTAAARAGHRCDTIPFPSLQAGLNPTATKFPLIEATPVADLLDYDACLVRAMPAGSLEQVVLRMDLLAAAEQAGLRVVNPPKSLECAIDKYLSLVRCQQHGLPIPDTFCCESAAAAQDVFIQWEHNAVVKPIFGAEGRGVIHLTEPETAGRVFRALEQIQAVIYLQRRVVSDGSDLRLLMLGGDLLGAIRRTGQRDFRTNQAQSGRAAPHVATTEEIDLARRACLATGVHFGGVDLIYDRQGQLFLLEVNGCPGWRAVQRECGISVADRFIDWLAETQRSSYCSIHFPRPTRFDD